MVRITLNIEAENAKDLKATIEELHGKYSSGSAAEELNGSYPVTDVTAIAKAGIDGGVLANSLAEAVSEKQEEPEKPKKPTTKKKPAPKKEVPVEDSTDSTSDTEPSETGETQKPTKEEPQKSATADHHPGATIDDARKLMKKAIDKGFRLQAITAMRRNGSTGEKPRLSEVDDYGVFMTDLEALMAGEA